MRRRQLSKLLLAELPAWLSRSEWSALLSVSMMRTVLPALCWSTLMPPARCVAGCCCILLAAYFHHPCCAPAPFPFRSSLSALCRWRVRTLPSREHAFAASALHLCVCFVLPPCLLSACVAALHIADAPHSISSPLYCSTCTAVRIGLAAFRHLGFTLHFVNNNPGLTCSHALTAHAAGTPTC